MRSFIAALLVLPLAWPASAQQRPAVDLRARPGAVESRPLPPPAATPPATVEVETEDDEPDERAGELKRQQVAYAGTEIPGTLIVDTAHTHLYLVMEGGRAMRYGIGVGRDGFTWAGRERVSRMAEWPDWHPPKEMIERQPYLPRIMAGGPGNPLGARALYLGNTLYRIHGTNAPATIGKYVSSGCIRLTNEDIEDLYARVKVGAQVVVLERDGSTPPKSSRRSAEPLPAPSQAAVPPQTAPPTPAVPMPRARPETPGARIVPVRAAQTGTKPVVVAAVVKDGRPSDKTSVRTSGKPSDKAAARPEAHGTEARTAGATKGARQGEIKTATKPKVETKIDAKVEKPKTGQPKPPGSRPDVKPDPKRTEPKKPEAKKQPESARR